ncbi:MAG: tRNA sulfurtransferase [Candidatus Woesearchaeota archaeon]|nr:tRNA sulfurtransferase [Candidatus Woesearchaeota archaeon]
MDCILVHYGEIGLKGENRPYFERALVKTLRQFEFKKVYKRYGRIVCDLIKSKENKEPYLNKIIEQLSLIPGITSFSFAIKCDLKLDNIIKNVKQIIKNKKFDSFRIQTKRSNKNFKHNSQQTNTIVGQEIVNLGHKVDLDNPELTIYIEITEVETFVYTRKNKGIGGLPVPTAGKVICSLSGGIDSPVAAFMSMKRGCQVIAVHFFNSTQNEAGLLTKLESIAQELSKIQLSLKLYTVDFEQIQKQIIMNIPAEYRMIIYRRFMMFIANKIAVKEKAKAIITGDSIGQVASQTLENINAIYDASQLPVLAPLIGLNKQEITGLAKKIGTYKHSILPYGDCCSYMIAKHPITRSELDEIITLEKNIENKKELIDSALENTKIKKYNLS